MTTTAAAAAAAAAAAPAPAPATTYATTTTPPPAAAAAAATATTKIKSQNTTAVDFICTPWLNTPDEKDCSDTLLAAHQGTEDPQVAANMKRANTSPWGGVVSFLLLRLGYWAKSLHEDLKYCDTVPHLLQNA